METVEFVEICMCCLMFLCSVIFLKFFNFDEFCFFTLRLLFYGVHSVLLKSLQLVERNCYNTSSLSADLESDPLLMYEVSTDPG